MFQKKIDELFNGMSHLFSIADDILIAGFYELGRDHDVPLDKVLRICTQANLKFKSNTVFFRYNNILFLVTLHPDFWWGLK